MLRRSWPRSLRQWEKSSEEFQNFVEAVRSELAQRHKQISAVVITNIYPSLSLDEYLGWRIRTELIEQPKPLMRLPKGASFRVMI